MSYPCVSRLSVPETWDTPSRLRSPSMRPSDAWQGSQAQSGGPAGKQTGTPPMHLPPSGLVIEAPRFARLAAIRMISSCRIGT
ncbi:PPE family protein, SVP subgroup [Burkholderia aenigmatica]|uniref:PPE family protein, SVP subgroup n=1 Tax=Burkholderia aenigmatica TaxID=2015348 RepID=UPI0015825CD0